tara:strand:+ start:32 stop:328 length:297 start_codon:yes stop_codon:yes gene_type:complete
MGSNLDNATKKLSAKDKKELMKTLNSLIDIKSNLTSGNISGLDVVKTMTDQLSAIPDKIKANLKNIPKDQRDFVNTLLDDAESKISYSEILKESINKS